MNGGSDPAAWLPAALALRLGTYSSLGGVDRVVPVDVYVPGCPPRPQAILNGLLVAMDVGKARSRPSGAA